MSNYRTTTAELRHLHEEGYCFEDCLHCAKEQTFDPPEPAPGRYYMTVDEYPEPR